MTKTLITLLAAALFGCASGEPDAAPAAPSHLASAFMSAEYLTGNCACRAANMGGLERISGNLAHCELGRGRSGINVLPIGNDFWQLCELHGNDSDAVAARIAARREERRSARQAELDGMRERQRERTARLRAIVDRMHETAPE